MPHSLVLNLVPKSSIYPNFLTGKHLHALFLTLVSSVDKKVGDRLHDQKTAKAFTLSPLQVWEGVEERGSRGVEERGSKGSKGVLKRQLIPSPHCLKFLHSHPIPAGTRCWWRISLLDDCLFSALTPLWLNLNPDHAWHLGSADLQITSVLGTAQSTQPWANFCSYAQLFEQASTCDRQLSFQIYTPATFRQGKFDSALPTRDCVFNSLLSRWNYYSGIPFPETLFDHLFPSFFNIHTELVQYPEGKWVGCLGSIGYRILGDVDPLTIQQLNTLADFALFAGIGRKTPMGMGMVRRV
jgi:CRISPR-associated endoribonuclease Cas6